MLALAALGPVALQPARAQTIDWAAGNGNWNVAANWNPQNVPNAAGETARFPLGGGAFTITLDTSPTLDGILGENPGASLNLGAGTITALLGPGITNAGTISANAGTATLIGNVVNGVGALLRVSDGSILNLHGPSVVNDGQIVINWEHTSSNARLGIMQPVAVSGAGSIVLQSLTSDGDANLETDTGASLTNGDAHTIQGTGTVSAAVVNNGRIAGGGSPVGLTLLGSTKTNQGIIETLPAGLVTIRCPIDQGPAGRISGSSGGTVQLGTGAVITGGILGSSDGGKVITVASTPYLVEVTNEGSLDLASNTSTRAGGPFFANSGTVRINYTGAAGNTHLTLDDGLSLDGSGDILLLTGADAADANLEAGATAWCTHGSSHTIHGAGSISVSLTNEGRIVADTPSKRLLLNMPGLRNENGTLAATGAAILDIVCDSLLQSAGGRIVADGGTVRLTGPASVTGGRVETTSGGQIYTYSGTVGVADLHQTGEWIAKPGTTTEVRGAVTNDGTITVNEGTSSNTRVLGLGSFPVLGSGSLVLRAGGSPDDAMLTSAAGAILTNGPNHTIRGKGRVEAGLRNEGTILADQGGVGLVLSGQDKQNLGWIGTGAGGILTIASSLISQEGSGRIVAEDGSIAVSAGRITGGVLESSGTGAIRNTASGSRLTGVRNEADLRIAPSTVLAAAGPALENNRTIRINDTGGSGNTYLTAETDLLVSGSGEILLRTAGSPADANLSTQPGVTLTIGEQQTIRGEGEISATLTHLGTILGDVAGRPLTLTTNEKSNEGTMRAASGGRLLLASGTLTNRALVEAADSSSVQVSGGTLHNLADVRAREAGTFQVLSAGICRNEGLLIAEDGGKILQTGGTVENTGTLRAGAQGESRVSAGLFRNTEGAVEATAGGLFWCDELGQHFAIGKLTGGAWRAIGAGQLRLIGANVTTLDAEVVLDGPDARIWSNEGTIEALAGMTAIGPQGIFEIRGARAETRAGALSSAGQVRVAAGSSLTVNGAYRQTLGTAVGSIDGTLSSPDTVRIESGVLRGGGRIAGNVRNYHGVVQPGASVGHLTIDGMFQQQGAGEIVIELGGTDPGESDLLEITGVARLGGTLRLRAVEGYQPHEGDTIEILRFASRISSFSQLALCPAPGVCGELLWTGTSLSVVLHVLPTSDVQEPIDEEKPEEPAEPEETATPEETGTEAASLPSELRLFTSLERSGFPVVHLDLPFAAEVTLQVFGVTGRRMATLAAGLLPGGSHSFRWDGTVGGGERAPRGVYFLKGWICAEGRMQERGSRLLWLQ
ncbi:MAG: FlgD immunoglobulin-like domain containing protein [Candidatus Eisenbacteria bacterium]